MKRSLRSINFILMFVLCFGALGFTPRAVEAAPGALRISQVYGGAGCTTVGCSTYKNDFVEILNIGTAPIDLSTYSVQYASAAGNFGSSSSNVIPLVGTINAGQYYLIKGAFNTNGVNILPEADASASSTSAFAMSATGGKVALINGTSALGCGATGTTPVPCSQTQLDKIIDLVGYGTTPTMYEGTGPTPAPSTTTAVFRAGGGCVDTDNNAADFTAAAPAPRNTDSTTNSCGPAEIFPDDLFISEYIEGSSNNKALEIYNGTGAAVNLMGYKVVLYPNGTTTPGNTLTWATETLLADGDVYVIANSAADPAILAVADITSTVTYYGGDDAVALQRVSDSSYVDVIGQIGFDPGTVWGTGDNTTGEHTLTRMDTICTGDTNGSDAFDPVNEWNASAQNTFTYLGSHTTNCFPLSEEAPTVTSTTPADGAAGIGTADDIVIAFSEPVTVTDPWFTISCASSGVHAAVVIDTDPVFTLNPAVDFQPNEVCTVTILASGVKDDDTEDATYNYMLANYLFDFTVAGECSDPYTSISAIQGTGETSPLANTEVSTEGIVVGDFQTNAYVSGTKNGFYIQSLPDADDDNPATSDGLFVYSYAKDVSVGDHVRVTGKVVEFMGLTELSPVNQVLTCSTGHVITPTVVSLPVTALTDWEKFESMLVTFTQPLFISEYFNYDYKGEIVLETERFMTFTAANEPDPAGFTAWNTDLQLNSITLDDGRHIDNPDPALHPNGAIFDMSNLFRGGGTLTNVTGIMDFYSGSYRIQPTKGADYTDTNPRTAAPDVQPGELTVASFNVLNYFLSIDTGSSSWVCGPSGNMECRGADSAEELTRQRAKILAAMAGIEADIFGLMEIQNDTGASTADLVAGLNDVFGADTYDYIDTGFIGTDAIKQAIIYKPSAVTPVGTYKILTSAIDPRFIDTRNRPALAQVFEDNITGETFVVAVNHLKSKGSACSGDPDLLDGASNCNITRKTAALALVDWLANPTYFAGIENILIIGDLNSYDKEDPIDMIKLGADDTADTADDYHDMLHEIRGENAYGYLFGAQIGYLDYALANKTLADYIVDVNFWHINADEPDIINYDMYFKLPAQDALYAPDAYKASDHDPVVITLTLNHAPVATPDAYQTDEDIAIQAVAPGVLANDTDVNPNDTLTVDLVTGVASGTLVLNADGSFLYTPALNFFGEVSFTYRVFDGKVYSNTVTVTITVLPVNDSPVAEDDLYETDQDVALVVAAPGVLDNDSDPDPSDMFTVVLMTPTQHGTVVLQADGSFTYTPVPGFSGTDTFTYALISMARGGYADTATVTITVHPVYHYYLPLIIK